MSPELRNVGIGMIFGSILALLGIGYLSSAIYGLGGSGKLVDPVIEGAEKAGANKAEGAAATAKAPKKVDIATLIASADAGKGAKTFKKKCLVCHSINEGDKHKVGPNLFAIAKRGIAKAAGYKYSKAMLAKNKEPWSDDNLNQWLIKPAAFIKKNKMSFAGMKKDKNRANLIAYMKSMQ